MSRPLRADEPSSAIVKIRLTPSERSLVVKAAGINRQPVAAFVRDAVQEAAADCLERGFCGPKTRAQP
jgi:uncharacterized protein (DUF1778 family)